MLRVLLDADGLLQRFGRLDPDAVGLAATLTRLQERVARRPRPRGLSGAERERQRMLALDVAAVRFGGPAAEPDRRQLAGLPLLALPDTADLGPGDLYVTAAHTRLAAALREGASAYLVGLDPAVSERAVDIATVPRLVEEALRLPTARPRSAATRQGGLLAIDVASRAHARAEVLDVIRADPNADWAVLGTHLLVYTEDTDVEDRLAERPGVERLSYRVNRDDLVVFVPGGSSDGGDGTGRRGAAASASTEGDGVLFARDGVIVRQQEAGARVSTWAPDGPADEAGGAWRAWRDVRRRSFDVAGTGAVGGRRGLTATVDDDEIDGFRARVGDLAGILRSRLGAPVGGTLLSALRELTGPAALADAWPGDTPSSPDDTPCDVAWQTPYPDVESDALVIVRHDLTSGGHVPRDAHAPDAGDLDGLAHAVAVAVATAELLGRRRGAPGAVHVLRLRATSAGGVDAPSPEALFLLDTERNRVRAAATFPSDVDDVAGLRAVVAQLATPGSSRGDL